MLIEIHFVRNAIVSPPQSLASKEVGASVEFLGIVREMERGQPLEGLEYEAYLPMAKHQLGRIFTSLGTSIPCLAVHFIHRLGWVPVGEASLLLRVQASHRGDALRFCGEAIDRMKIDVPIWKRTEHLA